MPIPRYIRAYRTPLRARGAGTARKAPNRAKVYALVSMRARGRCELPSCGVAWEATGGLLDPHHAFQRGHLAGIPAAYCDSPELVMGLCRDCHDAITAGNLVLTAEARALALQRFAAKHGLDLKALIADAGPDLVDVLREGVRRLEAADA